MRSAVAIGLSDPIAQRDAWQQELSYLNIAEFYSTTADTSAMRTEAQSKLDQLEGISRLQFQPVVSGLNAQISRMAANENDLYLLDAVHGNVLHIAINANGLFQPDNSFNCAPGTYGSYTVGPLVDLLILPSGQFTECGSDGSGCSRKSALLRTRTSSASHSASAARYELGNG